ncbi:PqiC family protein [Pseudomonas duriflava]|nr:PqiC family protein [Pseudomonas duriflava]
MKRTYRTALGAVALSMVLSGCASLYPTHYYQLGSGAATAPTAKAGMAVQIRSVDIADYLSRSTLMQRQTDGSLSSSHARWAGSFSKDLQQVLLRQLAWRLDSNRVIIGDAPEGYKPEIVVDLDILRLDSGPEQPAILDARWHLLDGDVRLSGSRLVHLQQTHDGSEADQVKAQSVLLQQLAKQMAMAVSTARQAALKVKKTAVPKPIKPQVTQEAEIPVQGVPQVMPIRTGAEVYRF